MAHGFDASSIVPALSVADATAPVDTDYPVSHMELGRVGINP
jgi:hypothetical protein